MTARRTDKVDQLESAQRFVGAKLAGRNAAYLLIDQVATTTIRLIYLFALARYLMPSSYGLLNYASAWYLAWLPLTYLGTDIVLGREISKRSESAPALLAVTLLLRSCASLLTLALVASFAMIAESDPHVRLLIVFFGLALIGRSLWLWSAAAFTAFEESGSVLRFDVSFRILEVGALLFYLSQLGPDLRGVALIHSFSWSFQGLLGVVTIRRRHPIQFGQMRIEVLALMQEALPAATFGIAIAAFFQLPVMLFRQSQGMGDTLGYFALGYQVLSYLLSMPYVAASAFLPVLSRSAIRQDGKDRAAALRAVGIIIIGGVLFAVVGSLIAEPLIAVVFGGTYAPAGRVLGEGLWILIPGSLALLVQHLLFSNASRSLLTTVAPCFGVLAMVLLFPTLVAENLYRGALCSVGIGLVVWLALASVEAIRTGLFRQRLAREEKP